MSAAVVPASRFWQFADEGKWDEYFPHAKYEAY